jgi:Fe-S-cluster formation regulator IscX/YfhJ
VDVYGFGVRKTPESFKQACLKFIYTENLLPGLSASNATSTGPLHPPTAATPLIKKVIAQIESDEDGWVPLSEVGKRLDNLEPDFDPRTFGCAKLSDLVRKTNSFEIDHPRGGTMLIRSKDPPANQAKSKPVRKTERRRMDAGRLPKARLLRVKSGSK